MTGYLLTYRADVEGDWLRTPADRTLYATAAAAQAAWARAYRGPDDLGHRAYPDIVEVQVDLDAVPGRIYVPGHGYLQVTEVAPLAAAGAPARGATSCDHPTSEVADDECACGARCTQAVRQDGVCYDAACPLHGET